MGQQTISRKQVGTWNPFRQRYELVGLVQEDIDLLLMYACNGKVKAEAALMAELAKPKRNEARMDSLMDEIATATRLQEILSNAKTMGVLYGERGV